MRYALLVATSDYFDPRLRGLHTAEEARELKQLLAEEDLGGYDTVHALINETKAAIERAIEEHFRKCEPGDLVLLYIAGHGIKNDDNQLFFAASNTDLDLPYSTAVPAQIVHSMVTECQAGSKAIVLDCCYSGVFNEGSVPRSGESLNLEEQLGGGLFTMTATNEIEYAYENQRSMENRPQPGSTFTSAIIEAMRSGVPDTDNDGVMTFNELYTFVHKVVTDEGRQTPTRGGNQYGDMVFARVRGARLTIPNLRPLRIGELLADRPKGSDATSPVPIGRTHESDPRPAETIGLDLFGHDGHVAVVGRIHSGKSTLLQTTIVSLTATSGAHQVQFKCLDGDGRLAGLSQVYSAGHTPEAVAELLGEVEELIDRRRELFASGISTIERYRRLRRERPELLPGSDHAETFLIIDGWAWFAGQVPDLPAAVVRIASTGLTFGVHVIITARSWSELPDELVHLLQGRVELALQDPEESKLDSKLSASLPVDGWALYEGSRFQVAQPYFDEPVDDITDFTEQLALLSGEAEQEPAPPPAPPSPTAPLGLFPLLGRTDVTTFDPGADWRPGVGQRYRAAIGSWDDTATILDLKDSAAGGMGPHGLCVGAEGSGKSEFLRTVVLSLMATHSPEEINFLLVNGADGGTFADFQDAPHVSGVISDLRDDRQLVDRMHDALSGEIQRRQSLLGEVRARDVWEYRERVEQDLPPLPMLFVVIDDFTELLHERPDLADLFVLIGRMGRSLQVQLLLSGRRVDESALRGLEGHLTYRIALRTLNASDSRDAIGVADAAELPETGGHGYLRHATEVTRFRAAYVSGPVPGDPRAEAEARSELRVAVRRMRGTGPSARPIWLRPLREPPALERLLPPQAERRRGPRLHAPIGVIDVPFEHKQEPMRVDLSGGSGHVAIVGATGSGKSVAVRTLLLSLAQTHTPEEVQFYCVDLGGGALHAVRDLPHVGAVSERTEPDVLRRTIAELRALLAWREARFIDRGISSMAAYRDQRRRGEGLDDDPYGDVFLIVDGWAALQGEFAGADRDVVNLAAQGLGFGLHVVVTADRWPEIRPELKDLLGTRLELRLAQPAESEIDHETAHRVPADRPGRGLHPSKLHMFTALPRTDAAEGDSGVAEMVGKLRDAWHGAHAPKVRLLPLHLPYEQLPVPERQPRSGLVPVGVNEEGVDPIYLDFRAEPHFYAFGEEGSGKTSLLRTVIRGITTRHTTQQAMIVLVDLRRGLIGFPKGPHLTEHAVSIDQLRAAVRDVAATLRGRLPDSEVARERPRTRPWSGPELFVVVDDYELVSPPGDNALAPLAEFVTQASAVGLHLVLARDSDNANRALHDPIIGKMREVSTPGLLMSADPDEGRLIGNVTASRLPPGRGTLVSRSLRSGPQLIQTAHIHSE